MANLLSNTTPRPEQAVEFFDVWFKEVPEDSLVSIVRIHPSEVKTDSIVLPLCDIKEATKESGLDSLIWEDDTTYDLYYSVSTLREVPPKGKRGGLKNVGLVPGVWIDLDVKSGGFESEEMILDLLRRAPISPTAVVLTGTGGVHGYWRLNKPVDCATGEQLALRWWSMLSNMASPIKIDRLCDPSRVLRIPGAIRWPKKTDPTPQISVSELLFIQDVSYSKNKIMELTNDSWQEHEDRIKKTRTRVDNSIYEARSVIADNKWSRARKIANLEEDFTKTYTWDSILEPMGWTKLGTDDDGRVLWSRPGDGVRKSATTDWPDSPDIMSLFSTAPETGLMDLHDSGFILTKYRVWVELFWGGNEVGAINALLDG